MTNTEYTVNIKGKTGSSLDLSCSSEGEMLDRVRIHLSSGHVESVTVTKTVTTELNDEDNYDGLDDAYDAWLPPETRDYYGE